MKSLIRNYCENERGQFAIMFSVIATMMMVGMVVAIDYTNMVRSRAKISAIADAAALAGATAYDQSHTDRMKVVRQFIDTNGHTFLPATMKGDPIVVFDDTNQEVRVKINSEMPMFFGRLNGRAKAPVSGASIAGYPEVSMDPLTIAFALDVSGSMGGPTPDNKIKIEALKTSMRDLFLTIEDEVEDVSLLDTALRTGMTTYNTAMVDADPMDWGWRHLDTSITEMVAGGGTNSVPALTNAWQQIQDDRRFRLNDDPTFDLDTLRESVIFMTDGDNNQPNWDNESIRICLNMRADGIELYSVAFAAPDKGQVVLIDCASWDEETRDKNSKLPGGNSNGLGCLNAARQAQNRDVGPCKDKDGKEGHYFDADDAEQFHAAFQAIAESIVSKDIRIKT